MPNQLPPNAHADLDALLKLAVNDANYDTSLFACLLNASIYVLIEKQKLTEALDENIYTQPLIITLENNHIPIFTSVDRIYDGSVIHQEMDYMKVEGRSFLEMTIGTKIIINPFSKHQRTLSEEEIAAILNGDLDLPPYTQ